MVTEVWEASGTGLVQFACTRHGESSPHPTHPPFRDFSREET